MTKDLDMLNKKLVLAAIQALKELDKARKEDETKKKELLEDETTNYVFLQIQLKKIPKTKKKIIRIKVKLPNSLVTESSDICLIVGDVDKRNRKAEIEPDELHYRGVLKNHRINNVTEVLTLRQLRTEYKTYEAKQKLLAAYDVFLADSRIMECLPKELGRHFFKKRKFPIGINCKSYNLKDQIDNAVSSHIFQVTGHGNTCSSEVAILNMEDEKIFENIAATVQALSQQLPGSIENVMSMFLRTKKSKAFPFYMA